MIAPRRPAPPSASTGSAAMGLAFAILDFLDPAARMASAQETATSMVPVLILCVCAIVVGWAPIAPFVGVLRAAARTSTATMESAFVTLVLLESTATCAPAPMIATVTGTASTVHATAVTVGLAMIAGKRCAPTNARATASASTERACATPIAPEATALCCHA